MFKGLSTVALIHNGEDSYERILCLGGIVQI